MKLSLIDALFVFAKTKQEFFLAHNSRRHAKPKTADLSSKQQPLKYKSVAQPGET